jgi:glycosyltransferase involved in cell wall biosynthesis
MPEAGPPEATVVIPTRNRWPLLQGALRSALGQEGVTVEVIVVDDGSDDGSADHLARLPDPRLRVLLNDRRRGPSAARNRGLAEARGRWVAFLDDDDVWSPANLRAQIDAAEAKGAGFSYARMVLLDGRRRHLEVLPLVPPESLRGQLRRLNAIGAPSGVVVRTDVARAVGGFDEELSMFADWDLWLRLSDRESAAACPEVLVGYTQHGTNMSMVESDSAGPEYRYLVAKHAGGAGTDAFGARVQAEWIAMEHRRAGRRGSAALIYLRHGVAERRPRDLVRAAVVLLGERVMQLARRVRSRVLLGEPPWLRGFRE